MSKHQNKPTQPPPSTTTQITAAQLTSFSGPLPHPQTLEHYNNVLPGAAERIFVMAETEAAHIRKMEELALSGELRERHIGQRYGLGIAIIALLIAGALAFAGHETASSVIGGSTVVGLAAVFVVGRFLKKLP